MTALDNLMISAKAARRDEPENLDFATFTAADGATLRYAVWPFEGDAKPRGTIVFLPGRTEFIEKFIEDMRIMQGLGFATAAMDLRGQGLSERPHGDRNKHDLDSFDVHPSDVRQLADELGNHNLPKPYVLMAHSAGSHVSLRTLHDHGDVYHAGVLIAPMARIATGGSPRFLLNLLPKVMCAIGLAESYVPGHRAVKEGLWGWRKQLTHDDDRFRDEDHFTQVKTRDLAVGGATFRWLRAATASCETLMAPGYGEAIARPVLILKAGEDTIVDNPSLDSLAARIPDATLVEIAGAKHEILKEIDAYRGEAYAAIVPFLDRVVPEASAPD